MSACVHVFLFNACNESALKLFMPLALASEGQGARDKGHGI